LLFSWCFDGWLAGLASLYSIGLSDLQSNGGALELILALHFLSFSALFPMN